MNGSQLFSLSLRNYKIKLNCTWFKRGAESGFEISNPFIYIISPFFIQNFDLIFNVQEDKSDFF